MIVGAKGSFSLNYHNYFPVIYLYIHIYISVMLSLSGQKSLWKNSKGGIRMKEKNFAIILGISLIISSVIGGLFFYHSRQQTKTIKVTGAATQSLSSDIVKWRVSIAKTVDLNGLKEGYKLINNDLNTFLSTLEANGIKKDEVTINPIYTNQNYNQQGNVSGYTLVQNIFIISKDLDQLEKLALNPWTFTDQGIFLQSSNLEYYISNIDQVKRDLLADATKDAKQRAEEIVKSSGDVIKNIMTARAGVFQITEPYSTEVMDYGIYNTSTREKDITVTVHVTFSLE